MAADITAGDLSTFKYHRAFYENAEKRDEAFILNLQKRLKPGQTAVIVAGGFHAQGLAQHLKDKGINHALVMPNISKLPDVSVYRDQMKGNVDWKSYFEVKDGRINLYDAFVRYTRDRLLMVPGTAGTGSQNLSLNVPGTVQDPHILKNWRDQIIRDLADEGKLEKAGEYTRFIDETVTTEKKKDLEARMQEVEKFIAGLKDLDAKGQFTAANITKLLQPQGIGFKAAGVAPGVLNVAGKNSLPVELVTGDGISELIEASRALITAKSEVRPLKFESAERKAVELRVVTEMAGVFGYSLTPVDGQSISDRIDRFRAYLHGRTVSDADINLKVYERERMEAEIKKRFDADTYQNSARQSVDMSRAVDLEYFLQTRGQSIDGLKAEAAERQIIELVLSNNIVGFFGGQAQVEKTSLETLRMHLGGRSISVDQIRPWLNELNPTAVQTAISQWSRQGTLARSEVRHEIGKFSRTLGIAETVNPEQLSAETKALFSGKEDITAKINSYQRTTIKKDQPDLNEILAWAKQPDVASRMNDYDIAKVFDLFSFYRDKDDRETSEGYNKMLLFYEFVRDSADGYYAEKNIFLNDISIQELYVVSMNKRIEGHLKAVLKIKKSMKDEKDAEVINSSKKILTAELDAIQIESEFIFSVIEPLLVREDMTGETFAALGKAWRNVSTYVQTVLDGAVKNLDLTPENREAWAKLFFNEHHRKGLPFTEEQGLEQRPFVEEEFNGYNTGFLIGGEFYPGHNAVLALRQLGALDKAAGRLAESAKRFTEAEGVAGLVAQSLETAGGLRTGDEWALGTMIQQLLFKEHPKEGLDEKKYGVGSADRQQVVLIKQVLRRIEEYLRITGKMDEYAQYTLESLAVDGDETAKQVYAEMQRILALKAKGVRNVNARIQQDGVEARMFTFGASINNMAQSRLLPGNFRFNGQLSDYLVNRSDLVFFRTQILNQNPLQVLTDIAADLEQLIRGIGSKLKEPMADEDREALMEKAASARSTLKKTKAFQSELVKGKNSPEKISDFTTEPQFNEMIDIILRYRFETESLEDFHGPAHKIHDRATLGKIEATQARITKDSTTTLSAAYLLAISDCREHANPKQFLFGMWQSDQIARLMREYEDAVFSDVDNKNEVLSALITRMQTVSRLQLYVLDVVVRGNVKMKKFYEPERNASGELIHSESIEDIEDHTLNVLVEYDAEGNIKRVVLRDAFYQGQGNKQKEYKWGNFNVIRPNADPKKTNMSQEDFLSKLGDARYFESDFENIESVIKNILGHSWLKTQLVLPEELDALTRVIAKQSDDETPSEYLNRFVAERAINEKEKRFVLHQLTQRLLQRPDLITHIELSDLKVDSTKSAKVQAEQKKRGESTIKAKALIDKLKWLADRNFDDMPDFERLNLLEMNRALLDAFFYGDVKQQSKGLYVGKLRLQGSRGGLYMRPTWYTGARQQGATMPLNSMVANGMLVKPDAVSPILREGVDQSKEVLADYMQTVQAARAARSEVRTAQDVTETFNEKRQTYTTDGINGLNRVTYAGGNSYPFLNKRQKAEGIPFADVVHVRLPQEGEFVFGENQYDKNEIEFLALFQNLFFEAIPYMMEIGALKQKAEAAKKEDGADAAAIDTKLAEEIEAVYKRAEGNGFTRGLLWPGSLTRKVTFLVESEAAKAKLQELIVLIFTTPDEAALTEMFKGIPGGDILAQEFANNDNRYRSFPHLFGLDQLRSGNEKTRQMLDIQVLTPEQSVTVTKGNNSVTFSVSGNVITMQEGATQFQIEANPADYKHDRFKVKWSAQGLAEIREALQAEKGFSRTVLGRADGVPFHTQDTTNIMLSNKGAAMLIDPSIPSLDNLKNAGLLDQVQYIYISHLHNDHTAGFIDLFLSGEFQKRGIKLVAAGPVYEMLSRVLQIKTGLSLEVIQSNLNRLPTESKGAADDFIENVRLEGLGMDLALRRTFGHTVTYGLRAKVDDQASGTYAYLVDSQMPTEKYEHYEKFMNFFVDGVDFFDGETGLPGVHVDSKDYKNSDRFKALRENGQLFTVHAGGEQSLDELIRAPLLQPRAIMSLTARSRQILEVTKILNETDTVFSQKLSNGRTFAEEIVFASDLVTLQPGSELLSEGQAAADKPYAYGLLADGFKISKKGASYIAELNQDGERVDLEKPGESGGEITRGLGTLIGELAFLRSSLNEYAVEAIEAKFSAEHNNLSQQDLHQALSITMDSTTGEALSYQEYINGQMYRIWNIQATPDWISKRFENQPIIRDFVLAVYKESTQKFRNATVTSPSDGISQVLRFPLAELGKTLARLNITDPEIVKAFYKLAAGRIDSVAGDSTGYEEAQYARTRAPEETEAPATDVRRSEVRTLLLGAADGLADHFIKGASRQSLYDEIALNLTLARSRGASVDETGQIIRDTVRTRIQAEMRASVAVTNNRFTPQAVNLAIDIILDNLQANVSKSMDGEINLAIETAGRDSQTRIKAMVQALKRINQNGLLGRVLLSSKEPTAQRPFQEEFDAQGRDGIIISSVRDLNRAISDLSNQSVVPAVHDGGDVLKAGSLYVGVGLNPAMKETLSDVDIAGLETLEAALQIAASVLLAQELDSSDTMKTQSDKIRGDLVRKLMGVQSFKLIEQAGEGVLQITNDGELSIVRQGLAAFMQAIQQNAKAIEAARQAA